MLHIQGYLRGNRIVAYYTAVSMGILMIVLAACGSNYSNGGSPVPTATPTTPRQVQNCGSLHAIRSLIVPTDQNFAKQDETCFWQAYSQCRPATLTYSQTEVDTGMIHNFSLKSVNGTCSIIDKVQHFIAPNPPTVIAIYTCSSMKLQSDGLHFYSCGQENSIFIPLASTQ